MIEFLRGNIINATPSGVVVDVQGVGYGVEINASLLSRMPPNGSEVRLWIYTHVREDQLKLFGFEELSEKMMFEVLLGISGIGPKLANLIVGGLGVHGAVQAVQSGNAGAFSQLPGVGARLSEKIIVDLKPKISKLQLASSMSAHASAARKGATSLFDSFDAEEKKRDILLQDVASALVNLGYQEKQVAALMKDVKLRSSELNQFQDLLKLALQIARGNSRQEGAKL